MQDKNGSKNEQGQAAPTLPPPTAPIPPANQSPVPPIDGQGAASPSGGEHPNDVGPIREDKFTKNDKVMMWLTGVIAFGTLVSAVAIGLQWREMVGGGKQTDKIIAAANINADAATKSAKAAQDFADTETKISAGIVSAVQELDRQAKSAELSRKTSESASHNALQASIDNFHLEQRAWISALVAMPVFDFTKENIAKITTSNTGKTFGLRTTIKSHVSVSERELISFEELNTAQEAEAASVALIAPNTVYETALKMPADVGAVMKGKLGTDGFTYIWGDISYSDVMTKDRHVTEFCGYRSEKVGDATFMQCKFHTDAN
jgi:hypothetical protein